MIYRSETPSFHPPPGVPAGLAPRTPARRLPGSRLLARPLPSVAPALFLLALHFALSLFALNPALFLSALVHGTPLILVRSSRRARPLVSLRPRPFPFASARVFPPLRSLSLAAASARVRRPSRPPWFAL